jgi:hypothetical protein
MVRDVDDCSLPGTAILWRAITSVSWIKPRASSAAYKFKRLSVYVLDESTPEKLRAKWPARPWVWFTARDARNAGCIIVKIPDDYGDESHREICPADDPKSQLREEGAALAAVADWVEEDRPAPETHSPLGAVGPSG